MARTTSTLDNGTIRVSVVVTTRGRMDLLDRCLDALSRQTLPAHAYEVIVVDDEPSHNTLHLVAGWRTRTLERGPRLVYLPNNGVRGAAAARNLGWRSAAGAVIAFTGDDIVVSGNWLAEGLAAFGAEVDVLCGSVDLPPPGAVERLLQPVGRLEQTGLCLANCFCRKSVLARVDGFDERFCDACRDDADLHFRLIKAQAAIVETARARVVQAAPPLRWGASLAQTRRALFDALLYKKHPELYRERFGAALPWDHYAAVLALLALPIAFLAGGPAGLVLAGFAWLLFTVCIWFRCLLRLGRGADAAQIAEAGITAALFPPLAVFWRLAGAIRYRVRFT